MVTGCSRPQEAAAEVLSAPDGRTQWCVIKLGEDGAVLYRRDSPAAWCPGLQVRCLGCVRRPVLLPGVFQAGSQPPSGMHCSVLHWDCERSVPCSLQAAGGDGDMAAPVRRFRWRTRLAVGTRSWRPQRWAGCGGPSLTGC